MIVSILCRLLATSHLWSCSAESHSLDGGMLGRLLATSHLWSCTC